MDIAKAKKRFGEWEQYALEDEQIIQIALKEDGPPNQICLHAQQMAEKYLKGYLSFKKEVPQKTHQLDQLAEDCKKYDPSFSELEQEARQLTDYYTEARYPGDIEHFSLDEARESYEMAKKIREFILSKINL